MFKKRFISMLVLLAAVVTGAWAQTYTVTFSGADWSSLNEAFNNVTMPYSFSAVNGLKLSPWSVIAGEGSSYTNVYVSSGGEGKVSVSYNSTNMTITISGAFEGTATIHCEGLDDDDSEISRDVYVTCVENRNVTGITLSQTEASMTVGGETLTLTATVAPDNAADKTVTWTTSDASVATVADGVVTAVGAGTATITATATNGTADTSDDKTATCEVTVSPAGYSVALKEGTDDAANWQGKAGEGEYQSLPLEGVAANTAVSVKYSGTKKVKSVKAVKKASAGPVTYTELKGGEVLHVGDIINLSEEISFNHGDYYMGSYGSPYTVVRADLTIDEYEEVVVNEKADGNYYVIIKANDGGYYHFEGALGVTDKSDGILVTYNGKSGKWLDYTFTVHEP